MYGNYKFSREEQIAIMNTPMIAVDSSTVVPSTEIEKGDLVMLKGTNWFAEMWDNMKKSSTRVANVFGFCEEAGSIYVHDIQYVWKTSGLGTAKGKWCPISLTSSQIKCKEQVKAFGW